MKAIVLEGPLQVSTQEIDISSTKDDLGILKILSTGICAADGYLYSGNHPWNIDYPIVPGHEIFGEISEVNSSAKNRFQVGDQVTAQVLIPCYKCEQCLENRFNLCIRACHFGSCERGGFAQFMRIPSGARIHKFEKKVEVEVGALVENFANAFYCLHLANASPGERVLILGLGSIGMSIAHIASRRFPQLELWGLTSRAWKKSMFERLGVGYIDESSELRAELRNSFDVVIECSGFDENLELGLEAIKPGGRFVQYGVFRNKVYIDFNMFAEFKSINLIGGHLASDEAFENATQFLSQNANSVREVVTQIVSFKNFASAFKSNQKQKIKSIFVPEGVD